MPIYEYECKNCGKISEFLERVGGEIVVKECKHCGSKNLKRIFSTASIRSGGNSSGSIDGRTCCGRDVPCEIPPCADGTCRR